jgi:hypothetical protein
MQATTMMMVGKVLFTGISMFSSIVAGAAEKRQSRLLIQEEKTRDRLARLRAKQIEAQTLADAKRGQTAAIAQAAAQGRNPDEPSMRAFFREQDDTLKDEIGSIRVTALGESRISRLKIRQLGSSGTSAQVAGFAGAGRSLFGAVMRG